LDSSPGFAFESFPEYWVILSKRAISWRKLQNQNRRLYVINYWMFPGMLTYLLILSIIHLSNPLLWRDVGKRKYDPRTFTYGFVFWQIYFGKLMAFVIVKLIPDPILTSGAILLKSIILYFPEI
jgi:hypothetical protein